MSARVNASVTNRPSPLLIRVYELKSPTGFNNADFMTLYQRDQAEMGADLLGRDEIALSPGESRAHAKMESPQAG